MSNENKTLLGVLAAVAVVLPLVLGLILGWPIWVSGLLILLFLLAPVAVYRNILQRNEQAELARLIAENPSPRAEEPPEKPFADYPVDLELPSALADFGFQFSATVCWRAGSEPIGVRHHNPRALAADLVLAQARDIAATETPERRELLAARLNSELGYVRNDRSGQVEAYAKNVSISLSEEDGARLKELTELRKSEEDWDRRRNLERNKREYLGQEVFKDTGSALTWWLVQERLGAQDVERAVELIGALAELSAAVNNDEIPELFRGYVREEVRAPRREPEQDALRFGPGGGPPWNGSFHHGPYYDGASQETAFIPAQPPGAMGGTDHLGALLDAAGFRSDDPLRAMAASRIALMFEKSGKSEVAEEIRRRFDSPERGHGPAAEPEAAATSFEPRDETPPGGAPEAPASGAEERRAEAESQPAAPGGEQERDPR